ncbi:Release factor glutamine methyltransferase [Austwickia sp. TVS 96-490-7B]|uniref:peptide chain release factor N(5)-glutamine methyltransferase n=1 Tax=Austwickia sp. TVS 96-490-7B TaxID=2830843 RepID=UPI001C58104A|nr:peptide chain release factor N(5)-glutamine methyltransferase [Austwickia sp. TVS 96-490-7B]MBW3084603.1 Release factor glutamine methyltransferase [Austwickia sp. TVS 96-490-7B]
MTQSYPRADLAGALRIATAQLSQAGVPSPQADAVALAAHLWGVSWGEVRRRAVLGAPMPDGYAELVQRRADRVPLQHLTGVAPFRHIELSVGPGVFVPRPETETLVQLALDYLGQDTTAPGRPAVAVDLCTGSAAVALAIVDEVVAYRSHGVHMTAVELSEHAMAYARQNVARLGAAMHLVHGDAADPLLADLVALNGAVDLVTCNPPYIPNGAIPRDPEVREHDPDMALYGQSADGLAVPARMASRAAALLRPGGLLVMEHADSQGESLPTMIDSQGWWSSVQDEPDVTGRPRVTRAIRSEERFTAR